MSNSIRVYVGTSLVAEIMVGEPVNVSYSYAEFARSGGHLDNHVSQSVKDDPKVLNSNYWSDFAPNILATLSIKNGVILSFEPILDCLQNLPVVRQYTQHGKYITEFAEVRIESPFGNHKVVPNARIKLAYWPK